jgi:hypothetical protein
MAYSLAKKIREPMAAPPLIISGPELQVKRVSEYDIACPKCCKDIRVTGVKAGTVIKCPHPRCGNVIWSPEYVPPWWARTRNYVGTIIVSIAFGVIASLIAAGLFEKYTKARDARIEQHTTPTINNP